VRRSKGRFSFFSPLCMARFSMVLSTDLPPQLFFVVRYWTDSRGGIFFGEIFVSCSSSIELRPSPSPLRFGYFMLGF